MGPWEPWGKNSGHAACSVTRAARCAASWRGTWRDIQHPPFETAASSYLLPHSGRAATGLHGGSGWPWGPRGPRWHLTAPSGGSGMRTTRHPCHGVGEGRPSAGGWAGMVVTHEHHPTGALLPARSQVGHISAQAPNPSPGSHRDPQVVEERSPAVTSPCDPVPCCPHPANEHTMRFQHLEVRENHTRKGWIIPIRNLSDAEEKASGREGGAQPAPSSARPRAPQQTAPPHLPILHPWTCLRSGVSLNVALNWLERSPRARCNPSTPLQRK